MDGIKKIIKDENGNDLEIMEYPDIPVIVVENENDAVEE